MTKPKCFSLKERCAIHKSGKYSHWSCGTVNPSEIRKLNYIDTRKPCSCGKLIGRYSTMCHKCRGKKRGESMRGKKLPKEWALAVSNAQKKMSKEKSFAWKGEEAGYSTKHKIIRKYYGNPQKCENCGKIGTKQGRTWNIQWANISGKYYRDISDYKGLCTMCHWHFDFKVKTYVHGQIQKYIRDKCRCDLCREAKHLYRNKLYTDPTIKICLE